MTFDDLNENLRKNHQLPNKLSYAERLERYNLIRERIFNDRKEEVSNKIRKIRNRYQIRKKERKKIASAVLTSFVDIRPYLEVDINGLKLRGLMDSGATICCLGNNCNVLKMNTEIFDFKSSLKIKVNVKVGTINVETILYLVTNLKQDLILGYDFWQKIGFKICLENNELDGNDTRSTEFELEVHHLSQEQKRILDEVKGYF